MDWHYKYYLLESGEILERAEVYRRAVIQRRHEQQAVADQMGARGFVPSRLTQELVGLVFDGEPPEGFTKPNKHGVSRPYKRRRDLARLFAQDGPVKRFQPMIDFERWLGCPTGYSYTCDGGWGSTGIGRPFEEIGLYWLAADGPIMLITPDVERYEREAKEHGYTVDEDALSWRIHPDHPGAREILFEEWELMVAKHRQESGKQPAAA